MFSLKVKLVTLTLISNDGMEAENCKKWLGWEWSEKVVGEIGKNDLKQLIRRSVKGSRRADLRLTLI